MWLDVVVSDGPTAIHLGEISNQVVHGGLLCWCPGVCRLSMEQAAYVADPD